MRTRNSAPIPSSTRNKNCTRVGADLIGTEKNNLLTWNADTALCANQIRSTMVFMCSFHSVMQFARIHTSFVIDIEKILNGPFTKFYNSDDVDSLGKLIDFHWFKMSSLTCLIFNCVYCLKRWNYIKIFVLHEQAILLPKFFPTDLRHTRLKTTIDLLLFYGERFYGFSESVDVIAAELWLPKTRPTLFIRKNLL